MTNSSSVHMLHSCSENVFYGALEQFGWMFYMLSPNSSTFSHPHDVPNYEVQIFPIMAVFISIEQAIRFIQRKRASRINDVIVNLGAGLLFVAMRVLLLGTLLKCFYFLYDNYRIVDLSQTAYSTWFLSLLLTEFIYYWVHRSLHEINIFWASHQFHHNAVELDVSTTLRDTIVDLVIYEFFPIPLALVIPPPILLVHMQFSLIYQVWLHTEVVYNMGPLEYIINTPRQHRVHHGKNTYCIDKNYGALIMIFDRLFGTYQAEEEKIVFGTTTKPMETFDTSILHFSYYNNVWQKFKQQVGLKNKLYALFAGPGWEPGKPRLGLLSDIPKVDPYAPIERYDPQIPWWQSFYTLTHGLLISFGFYIVTDHPLIKFSPFNCLVIFLYVLFALTTFGFIYDRRSIAPLAESIRCLLFFAFDAYYITTWKADMPLKFNVLSYYVLTSVRIFHLTSIVLWMLYWLKMNNRDCGYNADKQALMKEDKYIDSYNTHEYQWSAWQKILTFATIQAGSLFLWFGYSLRYEECTSLFIDKVEL